jgi:choice-of-anchor B domain-containing protein
MSFPSKSNSRALQLAAITFLAAAPFLGAHDDGEPEPKFQDRDASAPYLGPGHTGAPILPNQSVNGQTFSSSGVTLLSWIALDDFPGGSANANDIWGYHSPGNREYAIVGLEKGTAFVDVTDPVNPVILTNILDATSPWSDMAVYGQYAYNVNETGGGIQIIDMTQIDVGTVTLSGSTSQNGMTKAHNIYANPDSGYLYICGANAPTNGMVIYDLADPTDPQQVGTWTGHYVHDMLAVSYTDGPYAGKEIVFAFAAQTGVRILDATDKADIVQLSAKTYPNIKYCHQGWLSEDRKTLFVDDELDERDDPDVTTSTTYVINVEDLANPQYVTSFTNGITSIDHNVMVRNYYLFAANYQSGLRIFDTSDLNNVQEIGYFDSHPEADALNFTGAWGVYTQLPSNIILVSDIARGLFVLEPDAATNAGPADCDSDGDVDGIDFAVFASCYNKAGNPPRTLGCSTQQGQKFDFDDDGDVDGIDFSVFASCFNQAGNPPRTFGCPSNGS